MLAPSHYGERARWALDAAGLPYREERRAPGPHALLAKRLGLPSTETPILDSHDGVPIQGSGRILDRAALPRADPELEDRFVRRTASLVRQFLYAALLDDPRSGVRDALMDGVARRQASVGRLLWPSTRRLMMRFLDARPARIPKLLERVEEALSWFEGVLAARGERLAGDAFGRADLTAASLLAPLARPAACPVNKLYARVVYSPEVEDAFERWAERPAFGWVR